jgi:hypothetical protein
LSTRGHCGIDVEAARIQAMLRAQSGWS